MICNPVNATYMISCKQCKQQYVGKTCRKLNYRFTEHLRNISKADDISMVNRFYSKGHCLDDIIIFGIDLSKSDNYRKNKEQFGINK